MTERSLNQSVKALVDSFPGKGVTAATMASYLDHLSDLPEPMVCMAIDRLIRTSTFLPAIAEIRAVVIEACCGLPTEDEAWRMVRDELAKWTPGGVGKPWQLPPLVMAVVKDIGSYELKIDEKGYASRRFRELYRERRSNHVKDLQAGVVALDITALPAGGTIVALDRKAS